MKRIFLPSHAMLIYAGIGSALCLCAAPNLAGDSTLEPWQLAQQTEVWEPIPAVVSAPVNAAPSDAKILFDGTSLQQWQAAEGGAAPWQIVDGALVVVPGRGDIKTTTAFCDVQLHLEWKTPSETQDGTGKPLTGQARHNSGVFLQERYEVQILDSYQNLTHQHSTYANGQAGAIYKQAIPLVNAARAPGEWQTYDIIFSAPRFNDNQTLIAPAYLTVLHNGVLVQNHVALKGATTWIGQPVYQAHGCAPLRLQDHGNRIYFRNIWLRPL